MMPSRSTRTTSVALPSRKMSPATGGATEISAPRSPAPMLVSSRWGSRAQVPVEKGHCQREVSDPEAQAVVVEAEAAGPILVSHNAGNQKDQQERQAEASLEQTGQHADEYQRGSSEQRTVDGVHRISIDARRRWCGSAGRPPIEVKVSRWVRPILAREPETAV